MTVQREHADPVAEHLLRIMFHLRSLEARTEKRTRDRIIARAMSDFTGRGYAGTSMRQIAAGCGIQAASLYAHFPEGKAQLLREGLRDIFDEFLAFIVRPLQVDMDAESQLRTVVTQHVTWQLAEGGKALAWDAAVRQFGVAGALDEETTQRVRAQQDLYHSYVRSLITTLRDETSADDRMTAVLALCDQAHLWLDSQRSASDQEAGVIDRVWALVHDLVFCASGQRS